MKILILGSINMDIVSKVAHHPQAGQTVKGEDFQYIPGGKGSNQAIAAHRLGGDVYMVGKVGTDPFGDQLQEFFMSEGVRTENILRSDTSPTGAAFVAVDYKAENIIYVSGGANDTLSPEDVAHMEVDKQDLVSATLETPIETTEHAFTRAKEAGAQTVLNAAPAVLDAQILFSLCDHLLVNETELALFANASVPEKKEEVIALMHSLEGPSNVITTLGSKGVVGLVDGEVVEVEGRSVDAVDSTGAGDCFAGAFTVALQNGMGIHNTLAFANAAASLSVQRMGASSSIPTSEELEALLEDT